MPDRIIREELLESERWLTLKDNADRIAYIALVLKVDDYGNYSAEPYRLMRLWRDFGISTVALVAKSLSELADHDLIRLYQVDGRPYLNLPRFRNLRRYWSRKFPKSPFQEQDQLESNQQVTENPAVDLQQTYAKPAEGVGVGVGVGVKTKTPLADKSAGEVSFDAWYSEYPRKQGKEAARKAWKKINESEVPAIMEALRKFKATTEWTKEGGQYVPYPASWLNGRRWEDELPTKQELGYDPGVLTMLRGKYGATVRPSDNRCFYDPITQTRYSAKGVPLLSV